MIFGHIVLGFPKTTGAWRPLEKSATVGELDRENWHPVPQNSLDLFWAYAHNDFSQEVLVMSRPPCCRRVSGPPQCGLFKPAGVPASTLEEVVLTLDELEALRLADLEGQYQEQAAEKMNISRQTFGRIIESSRHKVAEALIHGKVLRIEGGVVTMPQMRQFKCLACEHEWALPFGTGRPEGCPKCQSANVQRTAEQRGGGRCGKGRGRCFRGGRAGAGLLVEQSPESK